MNNLNSPQMQQIMSILRGGANPEQLVRQKCKELGIDVNELMSMIK